MSYTNGSTPNSNNIAYSATKSNLTTVSPLPKPDFSKIELRESSVNYHEKGSYKRKKSFIPESPIKKNQKYFTPYKTVQNNIKDESEVSKKLFFGTEDNCKMSSLNNFGLNESNESKSKRPNIPNKKLDFNEMVIQEEEENLYITKKNTANFNISSPIKTTKNNIGSFNYVGDIDSGSKFKSRFQNQNEILSTGDYSNQNMSTNDLPNSYLSFGKKFSFAEGIMNSGNTNYNQNTNNTSNYILNAFNSSDNKLHFNDKTKNNNTGYALKSNFFDNKETLNNKRHKEDTQLSYFESQFNVLKTISEGSFGVVYLCEDNKTKIRYAVKQSKKIKNQ